MNSKVTYSVSPFESMACFPASPMSLLSVSRLLILLHVCRPPCYPVGASVRCSDLHNENPVLDLLSSTCICSNHSRRQWNIHPFWLDHDTQRNPIIVPLLETFDRVQRTKDLLHWAGTQGGIAMSWRFHLELDSTRLPAPLTLLITIAVAAKCATTRRVASSSSSPRLSLAVS